MRLLVQGRPRAALLAVIAVFAVAVPSTIWLLARDRPTTPVVDEALGRENHAAEPLKRCADQPLTAPHELRGMWVTTVRNTDWPSQPGLDEATLKAQFLGWLDLAQKLNHNAIFVQVRPSGDAFWPSKYAPWSTWLTG